MSIYGIQALIPYCRSHKKARSHSTWFLCEKKYGSRKPLNGCSFRNRRVRVTIDRQHYRTENRQPPGKEGSRAATTKWTSQRTTASNSVERPLGNECGRSLGASDPKSMRRGNSEGKPVLSRGRPGVETNGEQKILNAETRYATVVDGI
ncbi:hypothetical protein EVAR_60851_1 [Eumeta japonica]|uniref:Uncharacterized protein n=1 Tax=Eumeta variegata TaxID=151549 RepID=A0A4C1Y9Z4_EUMVA|nr:hypothetical protein EVAR_60851_1 [Eumeta japonica]